MLASRSPHGGARPAAPAPSVRLRTDTCSSYAPDPRRVKQPLRVRYPNLSPTRPPAIESDANLWPSWTKLSVEDLDLDGFDDDGNPLPQTERGW
jgi:hypothetical protein